MIPKGMGAVKVDGAMIAWNGPENAEEAEAALAQAAAMATNYANRLTAERSGAEPKFTPLFGLTPDSTIGETHITPLEAAIAHWLLEQQAGIL
jgi:hypothetical protein